MMVNWSFRADRSFDQFFSLLNSFRYSGRRYDDTVCCGNLLFGQSIANSLCSVGFRLK